MGNWTGWQSDNNGHHLWPFTANYNQMTTWGSLTGHSTVSQTAILGVLAPTDETTRSTDPDPIRRKTEGGLTGKCPGVNVQVNIQWSSISWTGETTMCSANGGWPVLCITWTSVDKHKTPGQYWPLTQTGWNNIPVLPNIVQYPELVISIRP